LTWHHWPELVPHGLSLQLQIIFSEMKGYCIGINLWTDGWELGCYLFISVVWLTGSKNSLILELGTFGHILVTGSD
jgi:hypothetical protein